MCDPVENPEFYLRVAKEIGLQLRYVFDTHVHADHVSTGPRLAQLAGAEYVLHESAGAQYPFRAVQDGEVLELGNVHIRILHTPGHTPEHVTLVVADKTRGPDPWFALTGHTLMVGDMGRTELASSPEEGARALFESGQKLRSLPDYVEVLPGAFAGSVCGRSLSGKPASTIGFERRYNPAFQILTPDAFVRFMLSDIPPRSAHAEQNRALNLGIQKVPC